MSFEAYVTYNQPLQKKMNVKTPAITLEGRRLKKKDSEGASGNLDMVQKLPKGKADKLEKPQASGADGARVIQLPTNMSPMLRHRPLPRVQPTGGPLPASASMSRSQLKPRAVSSLAQEEEAGFTRLRMNSKMRVFSGSKGAYPRKMMTLRQQCIQVLRNNTHLLFRVERVPYCVLEPVLESCTPDQLHRLEKRNRVLVEETDQLWKMHCHHNFKKERREEHESWREMYLRLQDAREQRLRALTRKIRSAHANEPKGRQAKMIVFHSFKRGRAGVQEKVKIRPIPYPTKRHSFHSSPGKPAYDCTGTTTSAHLVPVGSRRKKPAKQIAPLMAKTIKDMKNRFSRL